MTITTKPKWSWVEVIIENGGTTMTYDICKNELAKFKDMLKDAIDDIDYLIEKQII